MTTVIVRLPDDLKVQAEARAAEAGCASLEEYVAALIRADAGAEDFGAPEHLTFRSQEQLEQMLLDRLDGTPGVEATPAFWQRLKDRVTSPAPFPTA